MIWPPEAHLGVLWNDAAVQAPQAVLPYDVSEHIEIAGVSGRLTSLRAEKDASISSAAREVRHSKYPVGSNCCFTHLPGSINKLQGSTVCVPA